MEALPKPGDTHPMSRDAIDIRVADNSGTNLTVSEAVERYEVSESTLKRRLRAGELDGADKQASPYGEEWVIPSATLGQLWRPRSATPVEAGESVHQDQVQTQGREVDVLVAVIDQLRSDLESERGRYRQALEASASERQRREELIERAARAEGEAHRAKELGDELAAAREELRAAAAVLSRRQRKRLERAAGKTASR